MGFMRVVARAIIVDSQVVGLGSLAIVVAIVVMVRVMSSVVLLIHLTHSSTADPMVDIAWDRLDS